MAKFITAAEAAKRLPTGASVRLAEALRHALRRGLSLGCERNETYFLNPLFSQIAKARELSQSYRSDATSSLNA